MSNGNCLELLEFIAQGERSILADKHRLWLKGVIMS
jgi:hypothetical protein